MQLIKTKVRNQWNDPPPPFFSFISPTRSVWQPAVAIPTDLRWGHHRTCEKFTPLNPKKLHLFFTMALETCACPSNPLFTRSATGQMHCNKWCRDELRRILHNNSVSTGLYSSDVPWKVSAPLNSSPEVVKNLPGNLCLVSKLHALRSRRPGLDTPVRDLYSNCSIQTANFVNAYVEVKCA